MTTDVENNEWKIEAPYLASLPKLNPFCIPEQYFETLSSSINNLLFIDTLKEKVTSPGFSTPENYFVLLHKKITLQTTSIIFNSGYNQNGYSTPEGYFNQLQAKIIAQTIEQDDEQIHNTMVTVQEHERTKKAGKIVRLWYSDFLKYTSAACFILITAFGLYVNQLNTALDTNNEEFASEQMLYDIDEQYIIEHVQTVSNEEPLATATDAELETYILNNYSQHDLSTSL